MRSSSSSGFARWSWRPSRISPSASTGAGTGSAFGIPKLATCSRSIPRGTGLRLLFEHGAALDDPQGLLEGNGTQTRFITVQARTEALAEKLGDVVRDAVAERLFHR